MLGITTLRVRNRVGGKAVTQFWTQPAKSWSSRLLHMFQFKLALEPSWFLFWGANEKGFWGTKGFHEGFRAGSRSKWAGSRFVPDRTNHMHAGGYWVTPLVGSGWTMPSALGRPCTLGMQRAGANISLYCHNDTRRIQPGSLIQFSNATCWSERALEQLPGPFGAARLTHNSPCAFKEQLKPSYYM